MKKFTKHATFTKSVIIAGLSMLTFLVVYAFTQTPTTNAPENITDVAVDLSGTIGSAYNDNITDIYFQYDEIGNSLDVLPNELSVTGFNATDENQTYVENLTGLSEATNYHYRIVVEYDDGLPQTENGNIVSFWTLATEPTNTIDAGTIATSVTDNQLTVTFEADQAPAGNEGFWVFIDEAGIPNPANGSDAAAQFTNAEPTLDAGVYTATFGTLSSGVEYNITIAAYNVGADPETYHFANVESTSAYTLAAPPALAGTLAEAVDSRTVDELSIVWSKADLSNYAGMIVQLDDATLPDDGTALPATNATRIIVDESAAQEALFESLSAGTAYEFTFIAYNVVVDGTSIDDTYNYEVVGTFSNVYTLAAQPDATAGNFQESGAATATDIYLEWNVVTNAEGYIIFYVEDGETLTIPTLDSGTAPPEDDDSGTVKILKASGTSATVGGLLANQTYDFEIVPFNVVLDLSDDPIVETYHYNSSAPAALSATTACNSVNAVTSITVDAIAETTVEFSWDKANSNNEVLAVVRLASEGAVAPSNGQSYTGDLDLTAAPEIVNSNGNFIVYVGDAAALPAEVTNLSSGTDYEIDIYEFDPNSLCYASAANESFSTPCVPPLSNNITDISQTPVVNDDRIQVNWTNSGGQHLMIVVRPVGNTQVKPTPGIPYTANDDYNNADDIGSGNRVVYRNNQSGNRNVEVRNLVQDAASIFDFYVFDNATNCYNLLDEEINSRTFYTNCQSTPTKSIAESVTPASSQATFSWGALNDNEGVLITMRVGTGGTHTDPADGNSYLNLSSETYYHVQPGVDPNPEIGSGGNVIQVVYNDENPGTGVTISGLNSAETYSFKVHVFKVIGRCYSTASRVNFTTTCSPPSNAVTINDGDFVIEDQQVELNWQSANNNENVLIVARTQASARVAPQVGTAYTPNAAFAAGEETVLGNGNWVVFAGAASSTIQTATITGLTAESDYVFDFYPYFTSNNCYDQTGFSSPTITTLCTSPEFDLTDLLLEANTDATQLDFSLTNSNTKHVLVVAREAANAQEEPVFETTYSADLAFGNGSEIGTGNFVVYASNEASPAFSVSGLTADTEYAFDTYVYDNANQCYNLADVNTLTQFTFCSGQAAEVADFNYTNLTFESLRLTWDNAGLGDDEVIVLAKEGAVSPDLPADRTDLGTLTADAAFGSGDDVGNSSFVLYIGTGNQVDVTALNEDQEYSFLISRVNTNGFCYSTGLSISATTLCNTPPGAITAFNQSNLSASSVDLDWNRNLADADYPVLVIGRKTTENASPYAPDADYSGLANATFDNGNEIATSNYFVLFDGNVGSQTGSFTALGLEENTEYAFDSYVYNPNGFCYTAAETITLTTPCVPPTTNGSISSSLSADAQKGTVIELNWSREGNADNILITARPSGNARNTPATGTEYTGILAFGDGDAVGDPADENFAVYSGTADLSDQEITGLDPFTEYIFEIFLFTNVNSSFCYIQGDPVSTTLTTNCDEPAGGPSITTTDRTSNSLTINWTKNNGADYVLATVQEAANVNEVFPVKNTAYTTNANIASAQNIGGGAGSEVWVVYADNGNSITITGLDADKEYTVNLFSYNNTGLCYKTDVVESTNLFTLCDTGPADLLSSQVVVEGVTPSSIELSWPSNNILVMGRLAADTQTLPIEGKDDYTQGEVLANDNFVAYFGTGTGVNITGLTDFEDYIFDVYVFNDNGHCYSNGLAVTASTLCLPPAEGVSAIDVPVGNISYDQMQVTWTIREPGNNVLVIAREKLDPDLSVGRELPVRNIEYTANTTYGSEELANQNYIVYDGSGSSVTVTGLDQFTEYVFDIYEYNPKGFCYTDDVVSIDARTICLEPENSPAFSSVTLEAESIDISWTKGADASGNTLKTLVTIRESTGTAALNLSNEETYTVSNTINPANELQSNGVYAVYAGDATAVTVSALSPETEYIIEFYHYFDDVGTCYNTDAYQTTITTLCNAGADVQNVLSDTDTYSARLKWDESEIGHEAIVIGKIDDGSPHSNPVINNRVVTTQTADADFSSALVDGNIATGYKLLFQSGVNDGTIDVDGYLNISGLDDFEDYVFIIYQYNPNGFCYGSGEEVFLKTLCRTPQQAPSNFEIATMGDRSLEMSWAYPVYTENGDVNFQDTEVLVTARLSTEAAFDPQNGTSYTADVNYGNQEIDAGSNVFVVYKGAGTSFTAENLEPETEYIFDVYAYNSNGECYSSLKSSITIETFCEDVEAFASDPIIDQIGVNDVSFNWTLVGDRQILVTAREAGVNRIDPDYRSEYTGDNLSFGSGTVLTDGANPNYIMYIGSADPSTLTFEGLDEYENYIFTFYQFVDNGFCYLSTPVELSFQTLCRTPNDGPATASVDGSSIDFDRATINFSRTDINNEILVVARLAASAQTAPTVNNSYTASSVFGSGSNLGNDNFVIFSGAGTTVEITGLTGLNDYEVDVYEFNPKGYCYNLVDVGELSFSTPCEYPDAATFKATPFSSVTATTITLDYNIPLNADKVLVIGKQGSAVDFEPVSGSNYATGANLNFDDANDLGSGNKALYSGTAEQITVTELLSETTYHFAIYAYNDVGDCYMLNVAPATDNATTGAPVAEVDVNFVASAASISSVDNTSQPTALTAFSFEIADAGADVVRTLFDQITFRKTANDEFTDWTELIAGAELRDDLGNSQHDAAIINADHIIIPNILNDDNQTGRVEDGDTRTYELRIWLKTNVDGNLNEIMDRLHIEISLDPENDIRTIANSSLVSPQAIIASGSSNLEVTVLATDLLVQVQPDTEVKSGLALETKPIIRGVDANGNWSLRYAPANFSITNSAAIPMENVQNQTHILDGALTFDENFRFLSSGTTELEFTDGTISTSTNTFTVIPSVVFTDLSDGLNAGTLESGTTDQAVKGFSTRVYGESDFTALTVTLDATPNNRIDNIRLIRAAASNFSQADVPNEVDYNLTINGNQLEFTNIVNESFDFVNNIAYYFILADVDEDVKSFATDDISFSTDDTKFTFDNAAHLVNYTSAIRTYSFEDIIAPNVLSVTPAPLVISDSDVEGTQPGFSLTVVFDEEMKTTETPDITISPVAVNNTLGNMISGSFWQDEFTFIAQYSLSDMNVDIRNIDVEISNAPDSSLNVQNTYQENDVFEIDTKNPNPTIDLDLSIVNIENNVLTITIVYDEDMDTGVNPDITVPATDEFTVDLNGNWAVDNRTYTTTLTHSLLEERVENLLVEVSGAQDVMGNIGLDGDSDPILLDTEKPVPVINLNNDEISTLDYVQTVTVTYSEPMDPSEIPILVLNGSTNFGAVSAGTWSDGNTVYTASFTHNETEEELENLTISVSGAKDVVGNDALGATSDPFLVDTKPPTPSIQISENIITTNISEQVVTITYDEEMNPNEIPNVTVVGSNNLIGPNNGAWSAGNTVYTVSFTHNLTEEEIDPVHIEVSGGTDLVGNIGLTVDSNDFQVDTKLPTPSVQISRTVININENVQTFTITYDEEMNPAEIPLIELTGSTNFSAPTDGAWSIGNTVYTVNFTHNLTEEELTGIEINVSNGADIVGNVGKSATSDPFQADTKPPRITNIAAINVDDPLESADGFYTIGDVVSIIVTFDETVVVTDIPALNLNVSGAQAVYHSGTNSTELRFDYTVQDGDNAEKLNVIDFDMSVGQIQDLRNNDSDFIIPAGQNLEDNNDVIIKTDIAAVLEVSTDKADGFYKAGEEIFIDVTFDVPVFVRSGTPELALNSGGTALYVSGNTTNTLRFRYEVQDGHNAEELNYVGQNSLTQGVIQDTVQANVDRLLPVVGSAQSLSGSYTVMVVDTEVPQLDATPFDPATNAYNVALDQLFTLFFNEEVMGSGTENIFLVEQGSQDTIQTLSANQVFNLDPFSAQSQAAFQFDDLLQDSTDYYLLIANAAITDRAGNPFSGVNETNDWEFQSFGPARISTWPDGACVGETIVITGKYMTGVNRIFIGNDANAIEVTDFTVENDSVVSLVVPGEVANNKIFFYKDQGVIGNFANRASESAESLVFGPTSAALELTNNPNVCDDGDDAIRQSAFRINVNGGSGNYDIVYNNGQEDILVENYITGTELTVIAPNIGSNEYTLVSVADNDEKLGGCDQIQDVGAPIFIEKYERSRVFAGGVFDEEAEINVIDVCLASADSVYLGNAAVIGASNLPRIDGTVTDGVWTIVGGSVTGRGGFSRDKTQKTSTELYPTYYPSLLDASDGGITLVLTSDDPESPNPCAANTDQVFIRFVSTLTVNTGSVPSVCADEPIIPLNGSFGGGADGLIWQRVDDETVFDAATDLDSDAWGQDFGFTDNEDGTGPYTRKSTNPNAIYIPSPADLTATAVELRATPTASGEGCGDVITPRDIRIPIRSNPNLSIVSQQNIVCAGEQFVRYQVSTESTNSTFLWNVPNQGEGPEFNSIDGPSNTNQIRVNFGTAQEGINTISVQEIRTSDGCPSNVIEFQVDVKPIPEVEITSPETQNNQRSVSSTGGLIPLVGRGRSSNGEWVTAGVFSGPGVIKRRNDTYAFDPSIGVNAVEDPNDFYEIEYFYADQFGCSNTTSIRLTVFDGDSEINGLAAEYCQDEEPIEISVNENLFVGEIENIAGAGVTYLGGNTATFDPALAFSLVGEENILITYDLRNPQGELEVEQGNQIVKVNALPELTRTPINNNRFCACDPVRLLLSKINSTNPGNDYSFEAEDSQFADAGIIDFDEENIEYFFVPSAMDELIPDGDYDDYEVDIRYTYTNPTTGCTDSEVFTLVVNKRPTALVVNEADQDGLVCVADNSNPTVTVNPIDHPTTSVQWFDNPELFGDPIAGASTSFTPMLDFSQQGRTTYYMVQTVNGFRSPVNAVTFEVIQPPSIAWSNSIIDEDNPIELYTNNSGITVERFEWEVTNTAGDIVYQTVINDATNGVDSTASFVPPVGGNYTITLSMYSSGGCVAMNSVKAVFLEQQRITETIRQDFSQNNGNWVSFGTNSSWEWGSLENKSIISNEAGGNAWVTSTQGGYNLGESAYLLSPLIDLSALEKPYLALDLWYETSLNDGVVLQYINYDATDGPIEEILNTVQNQQWQVIGNTSSGANWYNVSGISSQQNNQGASQVAWSLSSEDWVDARHPLDVISEKTNVIFRLAFTSNPNSTPLDGVAVRNFEIGERNRNVLLESFMSTAVAASGNLNQIINNRLISQGAEVIQLRYHSAISDQGASDIFAKDTELFAGTRAFYYGINEIPRAVIDGKYVDEAGLQAGNTWWGDERYNERSLLNSPVNIIFETIGQVDNEGDIAVEIMLDIIDDIPANSILHVALVEKEISLDQLSGVSSVPSGEQTFRYVVRQMLPDPRGTQIGSSLTRGATAGPYNYAFKADRSIINPDGLAVVAFLQDEQTAEVYQAAIYDNLPELPIVSSSALEIAELGKLDIFPNPAKDMVFVQFQNTLQDDLEVRFIDQLGKTLKTTQMRAGERRYELDAHELPNGMYFIRLTNKQGGIYNHKMIIAR